MINIFDRYFNIKNKEGFEDCTIEKLDKLSEMLKEYGVAHSFCLGNVDEIKKIEDNGDEYCVTLMYEEEQQVTCELVFLLWNKMHRGVSDESIKKAMGKAWIKENTERVVA